MSREITSKKSTKKVIQWKESHTIGNFIYEESKTSYKDHEIVAGTCFRMKSSLEKQYGQPIIVKPSFSSYIKRENPFTSAESRREEYEFKKYCIEPSLSAIQNPKNKIYIMYWDGHVLFDEDLRPEPVPIYYDYIGTPLTDGILTNLPAARAILKIHPNVLHVSEILDIPYYNADADRRHFLEITVLPTKEQICKIYDKAKKSKDDGFWPVYLNNYFGKATYLGLKSLLKPGNDYYL